MNIFRAFFSEIVFIFFAKAGQARGLFVLLNFNFPFEIF